MHKISLIWIVTLFLTGTLLPAQAQDEQINWLSFEEAVEQYESSDKKILISFYTSWCGWCKKMDKSTYRHPQIIKYINAHYLPVKFDAEYRNPIVFRGQKFVFDPDIGRKGIHEIALSLMEGEAAYPSIVFLNEDFDGPLLRLKGFKKSDEMDKALRYIQEGHYEKKEYGTFRKEYKSEL